MKTEKVHFENPRGDLLTGRLALPPDQHPHNFAIFAHCFTCTKNLFAVRQLSDALTREGFGVLRFDFTGLGESAGDFSQTNFSGNVGDIQAAAAFLEKRYQAPSLLVGHSLGGAAVLMAASSLPSVRAVATLGAPSEPQHVTHLLRSSLEEIKSEGKAKVQIGGRGFTIEKQFLDDLQAHVLPEVAKNLGRALLILHSPQDQVVGIKNAEEIYYSARHPKSFVSLDGADHLLSSGSDALYAGKVIANWASRYVPWPKPAKIKSEHQVVARLEKEDGYTTELKVGRHYLTADEPVDFGGNDFGPSPYEWVSAGLSACTSMTLQMYARRKGWPLEAVEAHTSYSKEHAVDGADCDTNSKSKIDTFHREIRLIGPLDERQKSRLLEIADRCPVHRTLDSPTEIKTKLISE
ncbi:MAG: alpha/beta fold hydrolase [Robiginitalea sp.]|jgi:putative redox protein|uniref:bifunctional alpha/beta hydrolase/OsmC family protein n=1 Tax=Robiginitalea sp. TaxID=1902411 RepID=UPI003C74CB14